MNKFKLIFLIGVVLMASFVLSWGATRTVSGGDVTINIDNTGASGCIIRETIPSTVQVTNLLPAGGNYNAQRNFLKWIFVACPTEVSYSTTGSGTITGKMTSGGTSDDIAPDQGSSVPAACTPSCNGNVCGADGCGGSCGTCAANQNCQSGQCVIPTPECEESDWRSPITPEECPSSGQQTKNWRKRVDCQGGWAPTQNPETITCDARTSCTGSETELSTSSPSCLCDNDREIVGGKCSPVITKIRTQLNGEKTTMEKLSGIFDALRCYFGYKTEGC